MSGKFYSSVRVIDSITTPPSRVKEYGHSAHAKRPQILPAVGASSTPRVASGAPSSNLAELNETIQGLFQKLESKIDTISASKGTQGTQIKSLSDKLLSIEDRIGQLHQTSSSSSDKKPSKKIPKDLLISAFRNTSYLTFWCKCIA